MKDFITRNWFKLALLIAIFLAIGIYSYRALIFLPNESKKNKASLVRCMGHAEERYFDAFMKECKFRKLDLNTCHLPLFFTDSLDADVKKDKDECLLMYKLGID